jgi:hypothetical protein
LCGYVKFADDDGPEGARSIVVGKFDVPAWVESERSVPGYSPVPLGVVYEVLGWSTVEATMFRIGDDQCKCVAKEDRRQFGTSSPVMQVQGKR